MMTFPETAKSASPALIIAGPTASGKSALALAVAGLAPSVIINADSQQLYAALPILTAQPSAADRASVPHALYGELGDRERTTAGRWAERAASAIIDVRARGRLPVVVGGTGFYIEALLGGLSPMPEVPPAVRAAATARLAAVGAEAFHGEVSARDPVAAARLPPGDSQRLVRAWEVFEATGRALSDWQAQPPVPVLPGLGVSAVLVMPPRAAINDACDRRFSSMLAAGALDEAAAARRAGLTPDQPAGRALGFAELCAHLDGRLTLEAATEAAQAATRAYAKRQATWFRHRLSANLRLDRSLPADAQFLEESARQAIRLLQD